MSETSFPHDVTLPSESATPEQRHTFRFDAFVSYRRGDGTRAARWLRSWLRRYRLPKAVVEKLPSECVIREPLSIFLDTEFSRGTADYYENNIRPALHESEFLLVIASPQTLLPGVDGERNWVEREIGDFLAIPQRENIIAVATPEFTRDPGAVRRMPGGLLDQFQRLQIIVLPVLSWWRFLWWPWTWRLREAAISCVAALHHVPAELMPLLRQEEERLRRKRQSWIAVGAIVLLLLVSLLGGYAWKAVQPSILRRALGSLRNGQQLELRRRKLNLRIIPIGHPLLRGCLASGLSQTNTATCL